MRVTFLMPADDLTGGNRVVATYASNLQTRGHRVHVVSSGHPRPTLREYLRAVRHGRLAALHARMRPEPGHIARSGVPHTMLTQARPIVTTDVPDADIVISTWWETAVWMHALPASKGRKMHMLQGYEVWGGDDARDQVHDALRLPNRKIAISSGLRQEIESRLGNLGITVIPNAVDCTQFDAPPRAKSSRPTVGFIYAANSPFKGVDRAIQAILLAREKIPELQVVAFGATAPSADLPLPAGTHFVRQPRQDHLASLYAACDAWLFTSRVDSFGLPILEAMACRTPVIGVPVGAAPDLLHDDTGILLQDVTEDRMPETIATAILRVSGMSGGDWQAMSDRAYQKAHAYTWEDATDQLELLLDDTLSASRRTRCKSHTLRHSMQAQA